MSQTTTKPNNQQPVATCGECGAELLPDIGHPDYVPHSHTQPPAPVGTPFYALAKHELIDLAATNQQRIAELEAALREVLPIVESVYLDDAERFGEHATQTKITFDATLMIKRVLNRGGER